MSGSASGGTTTPQATPQQMLQLYNQFLPQSLATTSGQAGNVATDLGAAAYNANPIYTASGLQQLNTLAPGYQQAGANLADQQVQSNANILNGSGASLDSAANALNNQYNPAQAAANNQAANLVNSINLNGLSGGEQAAVERSLNQSNYATGNLGLDNATNAVSNAMNFGNALQAKRAALGSALQTATGVSAQQNANFNPVTTAFGASNTANNFGLGTFNPTQANPNLTAPLSFGSSLGNQIAGVAGASKGKTTAASGGCFLTTACCQYKGLPNDCEQLTVLRNFRDTFVPKEIVKEYYLVAPMIVERIKSDPKKLEFVFKVVEQCVNAIKQGHNALALSMYQEMVESL